MAGISFDGIANLSPDLQRAFQTALQAERRPLQNLANQKEKLEARSGLLTDIIGKVDGVKSLMPNLNTPMAIRELAVKSSDEGALTGTADKNLAEPGTYNIEILQLASSASAISNGFEDKDQTRIGSGYFSFTNARGETQEIFIDDENATLEGIARIINRSKMGMKASVVNDQSDPDYPWRVILTSDGTGTPSNVEFPEFYFIDGDEDFYIDRERTANNALVRFEGHEIEMPSNQATDLVPGVTVNLKGITEPGRPGVLTISQDLPRTTLKVKDLVDKLNGVFSFIQAQNKMDEKTDTSKTLGGEYSLRLAEQRLRNALGQTYLGDPGRAIQSLNDLGIQFTREGILKFDEKKFEDSLNAHFDEVVDFLVGDGESYGVMTRINASLHTLTSVDGGILSEQKKSEITKIARLQKDIENREKISEKKMEDLKMKLSRAQSAISKIQRQTASVGQSDMGAITQQLIGG